MKQPNTEPLRYRPYTSSNIDSIPQFRHLSHDQRSAIHAVSRVLPFRVNNYVVDELIDWDDLPNDPIFQNNLFYTLLWAEDRPDAPGAVHWTASVPPARTGRTTD